MGRLPNNYAGHPITGRDPYVMYGEMALASGGPNIEFPPATFQCGTDKPLEIHRMIPRLLALDSQGVALPTQPDQELLAALVSFTCKLSNREQAMTRVPTRIFAVTKGSAERTWEWADPEYLERSTGFTVSIQASAFPSIQNLSTILVCFAFEGFMIQIAAPSESR